MRTRWQGIGGVIIGLLIVLAGASAVFALDRSQFHVQITLDCSIDILSDGSVIDRLSIPPGCEPTPEPEPEPHPHPSPTPSPEEPPVTQPTPYTPDLITPALVNPALLPTGGSALLALIAKNASLTVDNGSLTARSFWNFAAAVTIIIIVTLLLLLSANMILFELIGVNVIGLGLARLRRRYNGQLPPRPPSAG